MVDKINDLLIPEYDKQIEKLNREKEKLEMEQIVENMIDKHSQFKNMNPQEVMELALNGIDKINEKQLDARNLTSTEVGKIIKNHVKQKPEIMDNNTATIRALINQLINNTGIIECVKLRFKKTLTPEILLVLSTHKTLLTEANIYWEITDHEEQIEIILEQNHDRI